MYRRSSSRIQFVRKGDSRWRPVQVPSLLYVFFITEDAGQQRVTRKSAPAPSLGGVQDAARASSSLTLSFAIKISASMCHVVAMRSGWPAGGRREQHNPLLDASIHHRASCCDQEKLGTKCGGGVHVEHHLPPGICSSVRGVWQQPKEARAEEMCSITPNKELDSEDSG